MFEQIKGKKTLITGANSGIGKEIARIFAAHGAQVGVHYRTDRQSADELRTELKKFSEKAEVLYGDLLTKTVRESLVGEFIAEFGGIDVLVNNAGGCYEYRHFSEIDEPTWDTMFVLHAKAPFLLARSAFDYMKKQSWGRVINISTTAIEHAGPNNMHYYASKAALDAITKGLAREGTQYNILVNSIRCGIIDTPMRTKVSGYDEEKFLKRVSLVPLKTAGHPLDVARMALYLASEGGNFITGEIIKIAGGE